MKSIAKLILLLAALTWSFAARAQFSDQATWAGTAGGTANALTLAVSNWSRNFPGVVIRFLPSADNTTAATVIINGVGSPIALQKETNAGIAALTGGELRTGQMALVSYDGSRAILINPQGQSVQSSNLANSALAFGFATNLQIVASVNTNALTIAVKTGSSGSASPADPTPTTPVLIPFRDNTIANGDPKVVQVTAALSFTIASGSTMGCVSTQMCRLWIVAICSSGIDCTNVAGADVVGLCAFNALSGTSIAPINESALQTSAAGTTGGNSAQTYYCNIASVTSRAVRILGYVDIKETIAGTWATGPTYTQLFGPGTKRPGDLVQTQYASTGSNLAGTNTYTISNTPPAPANGLSSGLSPAITPTAEVNVLNVTGGIYVAHSTGTSGQVGAFVYNTTTSTTVATVLGPSIVSNTGTTLSIGYRGVAGGTSAVTYTLYGFSNDSNTFINQQSGATPLFGGTFGTFLRIDEFSS